VNLVDEYFSREYRYALGVEEESGAPFVAIPVSTGPVDYEEAYRLDSDQYARLHRRFLRKRLDLWTTMPGM